VVNTPSITHYDFAKQVLEAGKHLLVEKPFTATVKEAQELIDLAERKSLKIAVFQNRRFDSDLKTVKKVLDEGVLGEIRDVEIHYDRYAPELSPKAHKEMPTPAVGLVYDLGSHVIDQALYLFGIPEAVFADIDILRPESKVIDYFDIKLFYKDFRVSVKSSLYVRETLPAFILHGTKGSFLKSRADIQEAELQNSKSPDVKNWGKEPDDEMGLLHTVIDGKVVRKEVPTEQGNYMDYFQQLAEAVRNNGPIPVGPEEGKNIIRIIEAAYQSEKEKRVVEL